MLILTKLVSMKLFRGIKLLVSSLKATIFEFSRIVNSKLPNYFSKVGSQSFQIYDNDLIELETILKYELSNLIKNKQEYPEGASADVRKILNKNIKLNLKDYDDKIISTFARIVEIAESCRLQGKGMYFGVKGEAVL